MVNEYFELDRDGVARQVTAVNTGSRQVTFTPALSTASTKDMEIRYWGTNNTNLNLNYGLAQNSLSGTLWNNVRYGGKDTSGSNCGAPAGGPGAGAGGESCGSVTVDYSGTARTALGAAGATNTGAAGVSIGPYELD